MCGARNEAGGVDIMWHLAWVILATGFLSLGTLITSYRLLHCTDKGGLSSLLRQASNNISKGINQSQSFPGAEDHYSMGAFGGRQMPKQIEKCQVCLSKKGVLAAR